MSSEGNLKSDEMVKIEDNKMPLWIFDLNIYHGTLKYSVSYKHIRDNPLVWNLKETSFFPPQVDNFLEVALTHLVQ